MRRPLVIAVDCDDVLIDTRSFLVGTYNSRFGTNVSLGAEFDESEQWGAGYDTVMERCSEIAQSYAFKNLRPRSDAVEVLLGLAGQHTLHLVTARKEEERAFTRAAIEVALPGVFESMEFLRWGGSKGEVISRIKADILIDDNARHLYDSLERGLPRGGAVLFGDYVWNSDSRDDVMLSFCPDWMAVAEIVNGRSVA